ncbi:hypothetical protein [Vibrio owensii]|uniref:hypothetical protein n=1 Tax=Vibrio owensii TaxID=696485 RepID=UPI000996B636|nr:hypothetical protein [Vibrio owensii]AQW61478.1 hypothetical protein A9237_26075 [Vibrio owensii]
MSVYQCIVNFRDFLRASWPYLMVTIDDLDWDESPYFIDDWVQANWELLVERRVLESGHLLVPYGYNISLLCRYKEVAGNGIVHRVVCKKVGELEYRLAFLCFKSNKNEVYRIEPPFDFVGVEDIYTGERYNLRFDELEFDIMQLEQ